MWVPYLSTSEKKWNRIIFSQICLSRGTYSYIIWMNQPHGPIVSFLLFYLHKIMCVIEWKLNAFYVSLNYSDDISKKENDLQRHTEENFELKDQINSLREELNRSQSELRDHVHSLRMNQTGFQDAADGDDRGSFSF